MVSIEWNSASEKYMILPGLYKLNSALIDGIMICEENSTRHEGIIEITECTPLHKYKYTLNNDIAYSNHFTECKLPNTKYETCWKSVIYDESIKFSIFKMVSKILACKSKPALSSLFALNGAVLIYGPPGTGKTTLAKAVAQKVAIRTQGPFIMREINCAGIFSRFYGESLQILNKIFADADDSVIYLVDEIESLISQRSITLQKNEPNDSLRLVNLFLSILDRQRGIFIFTSNYPDALDPAFLDRCDMRAEVGAPRASDRYNIIRNTLVDLMNVDVLEYHSFEDYDDISNDILSSRLRRLSEGFIGCSGRQLKKVIFEAIELGGGTAETLIASLERINTSVDNK
ncbi:pachytene checkpoint protein 2 [Pancytospora epiphaga]|nr:pachytene checkpoint protein 2 [Pancytospora epiphaga]